MRRSNQDKDLHAFAWSFISEMGAVAAGAASVIPQSNTSLWSMLPVHLTEKERMTNSASILNVLCESHLLEPYLKTLLSTK